MPRALLNRTSSFVYHVYSRSNNREWFYIPIEQCWEIVTSCLAASSEKYGADIHTLVLMSNHLHLLLSTPHRNLDDVMRYFLSEMTRAIQQVAGRTNHILGGRYRWSLLDNPVSLAYAYKYVFRNPVKAGICQRVEEYSLSTLNRSSPLAIVEGFDPYWRHIPKNFEERLEWLNLPTPKEQEALIGRALRRYTFKFTTASNYQRELRGLKGSYGIESHW